MLQLAMLVALGFVLASLLALMLTPLLWRRAVRLTTRRVEGTTPISMADIQADKDQLRAEFAISTRRLEMRVDELKEKLSGQSIEIARGNDNIATVTAERDDLSEQLKERDEALVAVKEKLLRAEEEGAGYLKSFKDASNEIRHLRTQLGELETRHNDVELIADERKIEIAALKTAIAGHLDEIDGLKRAMGEAEEGAAQRLQAAEKEAAEAIEGLDTQLAEARDELQRLTDAADAKDRTIETVEKRIEVLETNLGERNDELAELTSERDRLAAELKATADKLTDETGRLEKTAAELEGAKATGAELNRAVEDLDLQLARTVSDHEKQAAELRAEIAKLQTAKAEAVKEAEDLRRELRTLSKDVEQGRDEERKENALLRERLGDLTAQVAGMALALEGKGETLDKILQQPRGAAPAAANGQGAKVNGGSGSSKPSKEEAASTPTPPSLADRMRALQDQVSDR